MSDSDLKDNFSTQDILAAFGLLSRLPLPIDHEAANARAAAATWAYPLVGAALGAICAAAAGIALMLGATDGIAAAVALVTLVLLTGAMHEDGLADCADGLGGGADKTQRLSIMKDSRIGAYGTIALVISLLARWSAIGFLIANGHLFWSLVAVGAVSRMPMVLAMFMMRPARQDGLAAGVGLPPPASVVAAIGIAIIFAFFGLGWGGIPMLFWAVIAALPIYLLAARLVDGHTGDVLGASQQLAEIAALSVAAATLAS